MNKQEAKMLLKEKASAGYVTHNMLLDLYEDDCEDISQEMMELMYHKPKSANPIVLYCGIDMADKIERLFNDSVKQLMKWK